jgi:hypothetical protein
MLATAGVACAVVATAQAQVESAHAQAARSHSDEELAKNLNNPVAAMISVPFQYNVDHEIGPQRDGTKSTLNVQPVAPFSLNAQWNVISRTIVPIVWQKDMFPGSGKQSGIGDITQSFFFSPTKSTESGVIWGAGPAILLPTGSDDLLSTEKWGLGPTVVVLKQDRGWTYGVLVNHIWSVGGADDRADISNTFLQPFLSHTTKDAWTTSVNLESTYDWKGEQWSVPVNLLVSKLTKISGVPVSIGGGMRYWLESPDSGPHGWGLRLVVTLLFPK